MKTIFPDAEYYPAANGLEGYSIYKKQDKLGKRPDIVLMDHLMPEENGLESMGKILAYDPSAFVVFITANIQEPIRARALQSGAKLFLNKPLKSTALKELQAIWDESHASK